MISDAVKKFLKGNGGPKVCMNYLKFLANKHTCNRTMGDLMSGDASGSMSPKKGRLRNHGHTDLVYLTTDKENDGNTKVHVFNNTGTAKKQHLFNYLHPNQFDCTEKY